MPSVAESDLGDLGPSDQLYMTAVTSLTAKICASTLHLKPKNITDNVVSAKKSPS